MSMEDTVSVQSVARPLNERPEGELAFKDERDAVGDLHVDPDNPESLSADEMATGRASEWRVAKALLALREQVNEVAPRRKKNSDGTISDERHCGHVNASSDHCPRMLDGNRIAVVCAIDITDDPAGGCNAHAIAEQIRQSHDPRVKYIISNARIASSAAVNGAELWEWRPYSGSNPHRKHCHISLKSDPALFDKTTRWAIVSQGGVNEHVL
jgi:hypothetical protein